MRKILAIICSCFIYLNAHSSELKFFSGTLDDAKSKATKEKKLIFIDAFTEWCHWCKVMDQKTFPDEKVSALLQTNFVPMQWDMEKDYGILLAMKYKIRSYPTLLVLSSDGRLISLESGYKDAEQMVAWLNSCIENRQEERFPGISSTVELAFPEFYKSLYNNSKKAGAKVDHDAVSNYLSTQEDLTSEINWAVLYSFSIPKFEDQFLNSFDTYKELYGRDEVESKVMKIVYQRVKQAAEKKDDNMMAESVMLIEKYIEEDQEKLIIGSMIDYYGKIEKWNEYASNISAMIELMRDSKKESVHATLNSYSWNIYEKCNDPEVINQALTWMSKVTNESNDYSFIDTYAALLFKAGVYSEAELYANKAITVGTAAGEDVSETEELLKKIKAANQ